MAETPEPRHDAVALARILQRAAELQVEAGEAGAASHALARAGGLSAAEIREIAGEAGIDPRHVDAALAYEGTRPAGEGALPILGGSTRYHVDARIAGGLGSERGGALVAAIRRGAAHQGEVHESTLGIEWRSHGEVSALAVTLAPRAGGVAVEVIADRRGAAVLVCLVTFVPFFLLTLALAASLGLPLVGGLALIAGGVAGWLASATVLWRRTTAAWEARLARILRELLAAGAATGPAADGPAALTAPGRGGADEAEA